MKKVILLCCCLLLMGCSKKEPSLNESTEANQTETTIEEANPDINLENEETESKDDFDINLEIDEEEPEDEMMAIQAEDCNQFEDTDVPFPTDFFGVELPVSESGSWEETGFKSFRFSEDDKQVRDDIPGYNEFINKDNCLKKYNDYLISQGYSFEEKGDNQNVYNVYTKDNIQVEIYASGSTVDFIITKVN